MLLRTLAFSLSLLGAALTVMLSGAPASAQATRTWISGVGDDANPCSRTAPCKTFAGAISKTSAAGEINCLDPGGFGAVTITKSLTIDCEDVSNGGVLVSGTPGITVATGATFVNLRGLDINGLNSGTSGINIIGAATVTVERCKIYGFTVAGINFAPTGASTLVVSNTVITSNNTPSTAMGIIVNGSGGVANMSTRNVIVTGNASHGINVTTTGSHAGATIDSALLTFNGGTGLNVSGAGAVAVIGGSTVTGNNVGVANTGGSLFTYKDNQIFGNTTDGTPISNAVSPGPLN